MADHVFISYAREDQTYARKLADHLRQRSFDAWEGAQLTAEQLSQAESLDGAVLPDGTKHD